MKRRPSPLVWHVFVVVLLLVVFVAMDVSTPPYAGANIGLGFVGLPLLVLGVPWTLPVFINPYRFDHWSMAAHYVLWFGPALLNIGLHAALTRDGRRTRG